MRPSGCIRGHFIVESKIMKVTIALVQGDAAGIGPELLSKLLDDEALRARANILIVSDARVFRAGREVTGLNTPVKAISRIEEMDFTDGLPNLLDVPAVDPRRVPIAKVSVAAGGAVLQWFGMALDLARAGTVDGVCFMPFNKEAMHRAGLGAEDELQWAKKRLDFHGHVGEYNVIDGMWNARVTSHVPLREVAGLLTVERIVNAIALTDLTLKEAGFDEPRIAVAAINPHAGDGGQIGREEIDIIAPAVQRAREMRIQVDGPFPSDTLYIKVRDKQYDCAVSMYHDQGQIAIKLLGFHMGVTVLGGLPFPIATPAHGTAFDIAGSNTARVEPARRAFLTACAMAENRKRRNGQGDPRCAASG
jgi:4-hydroxythreonine-4-phosphate dehydrogenase